MGALRFYPMARTRNDVTLDLQASTPDVQLGLTRAGAPFAARYAVINLVGVALIAAAWAEDLLYKPFTADHLLKAANDAVKSIAPDARG